MGVGCPCPTVRNDIVTPRHLFRNGGINQSAVDGFSSSKDSSRHFHGHEFLLWRFVNIALGVFGCCICQRCFRCSIDFQLQQRTGATENSATKRVLLKERQHHWNPLRLSVFQTVLTLAKSICITHFRAISVWDQSHLGKIWAGYSLSSNIWVGNSPPSDICLDYFSPGYSTPGCTLFLLFQKLSYLLRTSGLFSFSTVSSLASVFVEIELAWSNRIRSLILAITFSLEKSRRIPSDFWDLQRNPVFHFSGEAFEEVVAFWGQNETMHEINS